VCDIGIVEQYKACCPSHFHYRQSCYPCHFIFSSKLDIIDIVQVRSSVQHPLNENYGVVVENPLLMKVYIKSRYCVQRETSSHFCSHGQTRMILNKRILLYVQKWRSDCRLL